LRERLAAAKAMTFKQCAESYIAAHRAGWRNAKHAAQWDATLATYAHPAIGALPVQAIDTGLVLKVLEPIWTAKQTRRLIHTHAIGNQTDRKRTDRLRGREPIPGGPIGRATSTCHRS
jgi:hypothetical protein